jgi:hypothetical protein
MGRGRSPGGKPHCSERGGDPVPLWMKVDANANKFQW